MNKFWKQTMALFLAFALVFGTLVPVVAWAEEPANVEKPTVESKPDAPAEEETQAEPEKKLTEEETEGKETEGSEDLEHSEEKTPDAQGEPAGTEKTFTVTKRPVDKSNADEDLVGHFDTFYDAINACVQDKLKNLYIVTMNRNYTIPGTEVPQSRSSVNILLRSAGENQFQLTRKLTDERRRDFLSLYDNCKLTVKNVILDGGNDTQFAFLAKNAQLTLAKGTVIQNCVDNPDLDGPAIFLRGNSTLNIEDGVVIKDNTSDLADDYCAGVIYATDNSMVNIKGGEFTNNHSNGKDGGVIRSGSNAVVNISGGAFENNSAKRLGGVIQAYGEVNITGGTFEENNAQSGGAIYATGKTTVENATFKSNKASNFGGAIFTKNETTLKNNCVFSSNEAYFGGAVFATKNSKTGKVENINIEGSQFLENYARGDGGAIWDAAYQYKISVMDQQAYRNLTIDAKTLFQGNKAGGGLFNPPENYEEFTNLRFDPQSDVQHEILTRKSLLNNYDVNYKNELLLATFRANGGAFTGGATIITDAYEKGATIKAPAAPVRRDYTFVGWLDEDGKNADFTQTIDRNRVFTANWDKDESTPSTPSRDERIIVDSNGGTFSDGTTGQKTYFREIGETFVLPAAPTREGYKFIAWEGKSSTYQPGDQYTVKSGGEVFTARWEEEKKPEEKPSVTPNIKTPKGTPLTPDEIAKLLAGLKKTVPALPRAGVGK